MNQLHVEARDLRRTIGGSLGAHEALLDAVLTYLALERVPAIPINTGPRVRPRREGGFELRGNARQRGLSDVVACLPPGGRLALLELKTGLARRSREQIQLHERFAAAGALCLVVRAASDLESHLGKRFQPTRSHGGA